MTNCDSIFNLLLIFETIHPFSINFASDRKESTKSEMEEYLRNTYSDLEQRRVVGLPPGMPPLGEMFIRWMLDHLSGKRLRR